MIDVTRVAGEHVNQNREVEDAHNQVDVEAHLVQLPGHVVASLSALVTDVKRLQEPDHCPEEVAVLRALGDADHRVHLGLWRKQRQNDNCIVS